MRTCDFCGKKTNRIHLVCFTSDSANNEELDELICSLDGWQEAEAAICAECFTKWRQFISYNKEVDV